MRPLFTQARVALSAENFLEGLLGEERRKTGWMRAEAAGDPGPWRQQAILGRGQWDADALRDLVRDYALETVSDKGRDARHHAGAGQNLHEIEIVVLRLHRRPPRHPTPKNSASRRPHPASPRIDQTPRARKSAPVTAQPS